MICLIQCMNVRIIIVIKQTALRNIIKWCCDADCTRPVPLKRATESFDQFPNFIMQTQKKQISYELCIACAFSVCSRIYHYNEHIIWFGLSFLLIDVRNVLLTVYLKIILFTSCRFASRRTYQSLLQYLCVLHVIQRERKTIIAQFFQ